MKSNPTPCAAGQPEIISAMCRAVKEIRETRDVKEMQRLVLSREWILITTNSDFEHPLFSLGRIK